MLRKVSIGVALVWATCLATQLLPSVSANQSRSNAPEQTCPEEGPHRIVPASIIENRIKSNLPVRLDRVVVQGPFTLLDQIVSEPLEIKNSVVRGVVNFEGALFVKQLVLNGTCFNDEVHVDRAHFSTDTVWNATTFHRKFVFSTATVGGCAGFDDATFYADALFNSTRIEHCASFERTTFAGTANFLSMTIIEQTSFEGAIFKKGAIFERADIGGSAYFRQEGRNRAAHFEGPADFKATKIGGQANFIGVIFDDEVRMTRAQFNEAYFWDARFNASRSNDHDGSHNEVELDDADIGMLDFGGQSHTAYFAPERKLIFTGLTYRRVNTPLPSFLRIMEQLGYDRQPYKQLEKVYRDSGHVRDANFIYFTRRRIEGDRRFGWSNIRSEGFFRVLPNVLGWGSDRIQRFVFGYGVEELFPFAWVIGLIALSGLLLARPNALSRHPSKTEVSPSNKFSTLSGTKRLVTGLWMSIALLIPKATLPVARRWRVSDSAISLWKLHLPITYRQLMTIAKFIVWIIVTIGLSLFSVSDLIRD